MCIFLFHYQIKNAHANTFLIAFLFFKRVLSNPLFKNSLKNSAALTWIIEIQHKHNLKDKLNKELPTPLHNSQCVVYKHEILICGGTQQRTCYSYHTFKNEYKLICEYPSDVILKGHCVVKLVDNDNNQITLLSFGSDWCGENKHTLVMKYVSIWGNISNKLNKSNEFNNYNQWIPFTDNHNHSIIIGRDENYNYIGARAVVGGRNNHLLFITYGRNDISVFDLNTFQFIKHDILPTKDNVLFQCFVSKSENRQEMMKTNKQNYQMILFCQRTGLLIEYDEDNNTFQFHRLPVCDDIARFYSYAYVCINDIILFFGGCSWEYFVDTVVSKSAHKYSIRENKWTTFQSTLPSPLRDCVAILNEEDNHIHIIGGEDERAIVSTHMKTNVRLWDPSYLVMICLFILMKQNKLYCIKLIDK
ncbi:hypothetical protein RFI_32621 [Reticulomyxa filosa]|uniref:Kelch motif family protein n=1 Tax=Reticulomyxa filosa TaxID=46433 RepID=X6LVM8_RETFI|nr:hypothetical protein RFI_32621 [Reticulomyxa filosa]|eukprot:ETO04775.1 hypothetical protein RFI_32621 [Reticulomyxa filosa]